jgi:hypothetical protein
MPEGSVLTVYTVSGELVFRAQEIGYRVEWNGLTSGGKPVAAGVYYALVRLGSEILLKTVLLVNGS